MSRDALRSADQEDQDIDPHDPSTYARVLTPQVYNNAAPFLRVMNTLDGDHEGNEDDNFHPRDDMRVHPRDELALDHLAKVALDRGADTAEDDYVLLATAVPDKVRHRVCVLERATVLRPLYAMCAVGRGACWCAQTRWSTHSWLAQAALSIGRCRGGHHRMMLQDGRHCCSRASDCSCSMQQMAECLLYWNRWSAMHAIES